MEAYAGWGVGVRVVILSPFPGALTTDDVFFSDHVRALHVYLRFPICHETHPSSSLQVPRWQVGRSHPPPPLWLLNFDRRRPGWLLIDQGWMGTINWWVQEKFESRGRIDPLWMQRKFEIRRRFDNQLSKDWSIVGARKIWNKRKIWPSTVEELIDCGCKKNSK